jgi:uncharacterized tellurite resistance protein B-like protein
MAAVNPSTAVLEKLQSDTDIDIDVYEHADRIALTPHLVLAVSLLYMMASDGSIEDEESSQLQASIGGHDNLLQFALRYVQVVTVDQFLQKASEVLSAQDKLCILSNVCDSMLSDGHSEPSELALFEQFLAAFKLNQGGFDVFFKTIALKNDKSVLGRFEPLLDSSPKMTPHLALAASLLYMMTSDGTIGTEEIGQLEAVLGEFEGLQQIALTYVRAVKRSEFLKVAAPLLSEKQKLYILTNVCDSMLADGNVAALEDKLFVSMLKAFGFSENTFQTYYQVIEAKNIKPFDTSKFKLSTQHTRLMSGDGSEGEVFDNTVANGKSIQKADVAKTAASDQPVVNGAAAQGGMGSVIHRTMQDNVANVNQDFGGEDNIVKVGLNANDQLNVQKVGQASIAANLQNVSAPQASANVQTLTADGSANDNRQQLSGAAHIDNRQTIEGEQKQANKQTIDEDLYATYGAPLGVDRLSDNVQDISQSATQPNVQAIAVEIPVTNQAQIEAPAAMSDQVENLPPEVRLQNLFEDIDSLNRKLDDFEEKNKKMLAVAKQAREENKRREVQALAAALNRQSAQEPAVQPNRQPLGKEGVTVNVQEVPMDRLQDHDPKAPQKNLSSFLRWETPASQPNVVTMATSTNAPSQTHPLLTLTSQSPEQIWIGAKPADNQGLFGQVAQSDDANALQPEESAVRNKNGPARQRKIKTRHPGAGNAGTGVPYKVYVKATVTFVVLSCWASSISAIDTVRTKRFVGVLERTPVVSFMQAPQPTDE